MFRSVFLAALSTIVYAILLHTTDYETDQGQIYDHPYAMGALISALSFLLAFRANFSYNRYWEAFTAVHQMHSKWMDVGMDLAAFHLQSNKYDNTRPPAFGEHPELTCLVRQRDRFNEPTLSEWENKINNIVAKEQTEKRSIRCRFNSFIMGKSNHRPVATRNSSSSLRKEEEEESEQEERRQKQQVALKPSEVETAQQNGASSLSRSSSKTEKATKSFKSALQGVFHRGGTSNQHDDQVVQIRTNKQNTKQAWEDNQPPLLLQEGAHLLSLLSAVAMSTLRNDLEEADAPLVAFVPGQPWPHVDPDAYSADVRRDWARTTHRSWTVLSYLFGLSRNAATRTLYNAARPFRVIGGVSDAEIALLHAARGPYAKVALCTMWLEEFCTREHLNGGMGTVGAPIVSRLFQFTSDGMSGYNQARKIAYIPFPFPHAQITSLFVLVVGLLMPVLLMSFIDKSSYGYLINALTVMCFTGVHEVARELENPFQNVPNDIPLNNFQAQFNESLMQMFSGFHPDAYWEICPGSDGSDGHGDDGTEAVNHQASYPPTKERLDSMAAAASNHQHDGNTAAIEKLVDTIDDENKEQ